MIESILHLALGLPVATLLVIPLAARRKEILHPLAVVSALTSFVVITAAAMILAPAPSAFSFVLENRSWIPSLGARFHLTIDALGMLMLWITAFTTLVATASAARDLTRRDAAESSVALHYGGIFLFQIAAYGFFMAQDLLLLYFCQEVLLAPLALMILRGGRDASRRPRAVSTFLLVHLAGSLTMLLSMAALMVQSWTHLGAVTFDLDSLRALGLEPTVQGWIFAGLALGFLIRAAAWPLHLWSLDAATAAPPAFSILVSGVLVKAGCFGLLVVAMPLFPAAAAAFSPWILSVAVVGVLLASLGACAQVETTRMLAAWSAAWIALVVLAIFSLTREAASGSVLLMVAHTVSFVGLFYFAGILERRDRGAKLASGGGLYELSPLLTILFAVMVLSASAVLFAGFPAAITTLYGVSLRSSLVAFFALSFLFVFVAAGLRLLFAIAGGAPSAATRRAWRAPSVDEILVLLLIALLLVAGGLFPGQIVLSSVDPVIGVLFESLRAAL